MKQYEITFISGHTLKITKMTEIATSEDQAVEKAFEREGAAFGNQLISVKCISKFRRRGGSI